MFKGPHFGAARSLSEFALERGLNMLANILIDRINRFYKKFQATNSLYQSALNGQVTPEMLMRYIVGVEHTVYSTIPNLKFAIERSRELGLPALAAHYEHKIKEEIGHDIWAQDDEKKIEDIYGVAVERQQPEAITRLIACHHEAIKKDPRLFLVYLMFTEYFTVISVPKWVSLLQERCSIPPETMSVLTNHAELDKEHVDEGVREINALTKGVKDLQPYIDLLDETMEHYAQFCEDVSQVYYEQAV